MSVSNQSKVKVIVDPVSGYKLYRDEESKKLLTRGQVYAETKKSVLESGSVIYRHPPDENKLDVVSINRDTIEGYDVAVIEQDKDLFIDVHELDDASYDDQLWFQSIRDEIEDELDPKIQFKKRVKTLDVIKNRETGETMYHVKDLKQKTTAYVNEDHELLSWRDIATVYGTNVSLVDEIERSGSLVVADDSQKDKVLRFDCDSSRQSRKVKIRAERFDGKDGHSYRLGRGDRLKKAELSEVLEQADASQKEDRELTHKEKLDSMYASFKPHQLRASRESTKRVSLADMYAKAEQLSVSSRHVAKRVNYREYEDEEKDLSW